jgi:OOP family OmpA-OmpF porin
MRGNTRLTLLIALLTAALVAGCATITSPPEFAPVNLTAKVAAGDISERATSFIVILDASQSMNARDNGQSNIQTAWNTVHKLAMTLPEKMNAKAGLRVYGTAPKPFLTSNALIHGMAPFNRKEFIGALCTVKSASGESPLALAIAAAGEDFAASPTDRLALIIVSDGEETTSNSLEKARELVASYGGRLCIHTVHAGASPKGKALLESVAKTAPCGVATTAGAISCPEPMAAFAIQALFAQGAGAPAPAAGFLDDDNDGVANAADLCPGTPQGAPVGATGCFWMTGACFDTASAAIKPKYKGWLNDAALILKSNPEMKVEVRGHTDNAKSETYNKKLSRRRAEAVVKYLCGKGVSKDQLTANGYWFSMPAAANDTPEGRALNRRVDLTQRK